jgi:hypothetical protein
MAREYEVGDEVEWDHAQGTSKGKVVRVATEPGEIKTFHYEASKDDPRYIVESHKTGAQAAHKAEELRKA